MKYPLMAALGIMAASVVSCGDAQKGNDAITMLVGTYTDSGSKGIYTYRFDQETGKIILPAKESYSEAPGSYTCAELPNPSFLTITQDGTVYAVGEMNGPTASLSTLKFNREDFSFEKISTVLTGGEDPCYVSTDGKVVLSANYSGGSLSVYPVGANAAAGDPSQIIPGSIGGPDANRQSSAHVHCAIFSPDGKYVFATDFSADRILRFDAGKELSSPKAFPLHSDYGPRHIIFSPNGKNVYVIGELSGDITVFGYDGGELTEKQTVRADRVDARGAADIHMTPDGRFLYGSLRLKNDGIAIYKVASDGTLEDAGYCNTGIHPRNFAITPNGKFLLAACRDSNDIEVFSINGETGELTANGEKISLPHPVCVVWDK
ncbi:MAG: lactonase family protein [Bacteroidales bacterium]|nr:lactonase family protein [Bacteroidales bacterium]MBQ9712632.1 lactonase family protein [Bacteroidales bacterium]